MTDHSKHPINLSFKFSRENILAFSLILPSLILVFITYLYPAIFTFIISFAEYDIVRLKIKKFIQFKNFEFLINNSLFTSAVLRTIYFGLLICIFTSIFSFLIALLLNEKFIGKAFLRVMIVLPWAVPSVVSGVLWGQMFHADTGFLNALFYQLGVISTYKIWLADPLIALHIIAIAEIWKAIPFMTLFFLSGLQSLPSEAFEAAAVDGANVFQRFFYILFPLMLPIVIPLFLIQFVLAMKSFDTIFVLTRGGPGGGTTTLNYFIYQEAFETFNLGRASAAAYVLLIITLAVVLIPSISRYVVKIFWGNK
tara:strand:+ start:269 stop:1198 length:930 start_codon:yes stop_codon:yes gene_type:complete